MGRVRHPAARLHLVRVEPPELELLLEERPAHVRRVVQLARAVVVEDLREDARMTVEEELVEHGVVVDECLREPREARRRDLLQRRLVRLVADSADVQDDPIVRVTHRGWAEPRTRSTLAAPPLGRVRKS